MIKTVSDYLEITCRKFPDKAAIADNKSSLTFMQLRNDARKISAAFIGRGLFKKPIAIYMEKSPQCFAAMLSVSYSGNFYTVLDTHMPAARIEKILNTLEPELIITDKRNINAANDICRRCEVILYEDALDSQFSPDLCDEIRDKIVDTDVMFVLFTSGSTGTPKGVVLPHKAVIAYVEWGAEKFKIDSDTIFANQAPFYFILSAFELFQTIKNGAMVRIFPASTFSFPVVLLSALKEAHVNTLVWVPSALCMPANYNALSELHLDELKLVIFGGEVMPCKQLNCWRREYPKVTFVNQYGPTELTDITTYYFVDREFADNETLPIGKPAEHMNVFLIKDNGEEAEEGEIGELYSRGPSLTYGYYKDPERTAEVFVQNPLNKDYPEMVYKTGDLVYFNDRAELIFVGRKDFQIKHMGNRIELGEIEANISSIDGIERNCCLYDTKRSRIVMFYTGIAEEDGLKDIIGNLLPPYMVPSLISHLDEMPLNLNGKIDRAALKIKIEEL